MARYERTNSNYEVPLAYFDRKTLGTNTASRAQFIQSVVQAFPHNRALQRALTDYAAEKGRFIVGGGGIIEVGKKPDIYKIKTPVLSGKNKGKLKSVTLNAYLKRKTVKTALETGKKTIYIAVTGVATLKTPAQAAAYRRASKNPPALINWKETRKRGSIVLEY